MTLNLATEVVDGQGPDLINKLPNTLLSEILSKLPADEVVRTSILSRRWNGLWRYVSRLDFDPKRMISSRKQVALWEILISDRLGLALNDRSTRSMKKDLSQAVLLINKVLFSHRSSLKGCKILHFPDSCKHGHLEKWIEFLISQKGIQELVLTCEEFPSYDQQNYNARFVDNSNKLSFPSEIFSCTTLHALELTNYKLENDSPFHHCHNLRTLKLKGSTLTTETLDGILAGCPPLQHLNLSTCYGLDRVQIVNENLKIVELEYLNLKEIYLSTIFLTVLVLHSLKCSPKNFAVEAPMLRVFRAYSDLKLERRHQILFISRAAVSENKPPPLKVTEILEHLSGLLLRPESDRYSSLFKNLWTLSIDLDLNNIRELLILSITLRVCTNLQKLEINIKQMQSEEEGAMSNDNSSGSLPYPEWMLWDMREVCECITHTLNVVAIKGFEGKDREVEFVRHLITNATVMKRINIWCNDSCSREGAEATLRLLSLPRSSINVSINLKPGPGFKSTAEDGARFQTWILTLNQ